MRGKFRPPSFWERYSGAKLADLASPDQYLRKSVASASAFSSTHDMGISSIVISQKRCGHTPNVYKRSFCFLVRGHESILWSIRSNSVMIMDFDLLWSCGISTFIPRNFHWLLSNAGHLFKILFLSLSLSLFLSPSLAPSPYLPPFIPPPLLPSIHSSFPPILPLQSIISLLFFPFHTWSTLVFYQNSVRVHDSVEAMGNS